LPYAHPLVLQEEVFGRHSGFREAPPTVNRIVHRLVVQGDMTRQRHPAMLVLARWHPMMPPTDLLKRV
jgi:hypothetical protein